MLPSKILNTFLNFTVATAARRLVSIIRDHLYSRIVDITFFRPVNKYDHYDDIHILVFSEAILLCMLYETTCQSSDQSVFRKHYTSLKSAL